MCPKCGTPMQASAAHARCRRRSWRAPARPPRRGRARDRGRGRPRDGLARGRRGGRIRQGAPATRMSTSARRSRRRRHLPRGGGGGRGRCHRPDRRRHRGRRRDLSQRRPAPTIETRAALGGEFPAVTQRRGLAWGHSSVGRALEWHSRGRRFDSAWLHHAFLGNRVFRRSAENSRVFRILDGSTPADCRLWPAKRGLCRGFAPPSLPIKTCFLVGERRIGSPALPARQSLRSLRRRVRSYELRPRMLARR